MKWINSNGGPLIILSENLLKDWSGNEIIINNCLKDSKTVGNYITDYERACTMQEYINLIAVGNDYGIILGDIPMATLWVPISKVNGGILVRCLFANQGADIIDLVRQINLDRFPVSTLEWLNTAMRIIVMDSAFPGESTYMLETNKINVDLQPGKYYISTMEYNPDEDTSLILHLFSLA